VAEVPSPDKFLVSFSGVIRWPLHGLTIGDLYYLSDQTAGAVTNTPPTVTGSFQQAVFQPITANTVKIVDMAANGDSSGGASNVPIVSGGGGAIETVLQTTRDFGGSPQTRQYALVNWDSAWDDNATDITAQCHLLIEELNAGDGTLSRAYYNFNLSYCRQVGKYGIQMQSFSRRPGGGLSKIVIGGNTLDAALTYLTVTTRNASANATKLRATLWIDQRFSRLKVNGIGFGMGNANNIRATWNETDPLTVTVLNDLADVDTTGVS
jgi:hypothetical protein